jgi:hypothetical protein
MKITRIMKTIFGIIRKYATAYEALENLQRSETLLFPIGDQKTGVIAEFYARLYVKNKFPHALLKYGTPSQHAWDIIVQKNNIACKIQVKAVSAYSETSRISPIHPGWSELYLMRLDKQFWPVGFLVLRAKDVNWRSEKLSGTTMPKPGIPRSGSHYFKKATDELPRLIQILRSNSFSRTF